jgi:hypothetical protein
VGQEYPFAFSLQQAGDLRAKLDAALCTQELTAIADRLFQDVAARFDWRRSQQRYERLYAALALSRQPAGLEGVRSSAG